jgi:thymidylate synthase
MVSLFFRIFDDQLTLTATYRTHNALDAWLKNVYGLMKAQQIVSDETGIPIGPLTVISHSISVDPSKYDAAMRVANSKGFSLDMDANGQFMVSLEDGQIVVRHMDDNGVLLHEYRSAKAERIQHELNRDCAISDINHAMYIGRQLAKAEMCLKTGERYEES